ncbi:hypothetical protein H7H51_17155 [Mycolicibacterium farcinogenes]|nr:hypothetical protein [Mycolicibacterium farcinogenes]
MAPGVWCWQAGPGWASSRCSKTRSRQINTVLASLLQAHLPASNNGSLPDVRGRIQLARFMMGGSAPANPGVIADAAASAVTMSNLVLGEELARYALDHGAGVSAALVLADAICWQGRGEEAEELLARSVPPQDDEMTLARWGCLRAANLFFGCGRAEAAHAVLTMLGEWVHAPEPLSLVAAMDVVFAFFAGELADAIVLGAEALRGEALPTATVWAALATSGALALAGRTDQVDTVAQVGELAADGCECGPPRFWLGYAQVSADVADGKLAERAGV